MKLNYTWCPDLLFPFWGVWSHDLAPLEDGNEAEYCIHNNSSEWFVPGTVTAEDFDW